jgi:crotonobetainyl-CoA:carnitine CoA-transferase CaiB-like acyl-CoA transferase
MSGLTAVDATAGIAGAYAGKLLVNGGYDVVVVEPEGGHPLRSRRPTPGAEPGALWSFLVDGKRSVAEPPPEVDVLILDRLDGDHPTAARVTVTITPYGLDGPWARRPATDFVLQAMTGSIGKRRPAGRPPVYAGGAPVEFVAGAYAAAAATAFARGTEAVSLDVSMLEAAAVTMQAYVTIDASFRGVRPTIQSLIPSIEPTADGYIGVSCITAQQFIDFMTMVEQPEMAADRTLLLPDERRRRRDEVLEAVHAWTTTRTTDEIIELATAFRIPVAPIGHGANLPQRDHFVARGVFEKTGDGLTAPRRPWATTRNPEEPALQPAAARTPDLQPAGTQPPDLQPAVARRADRPLQGLKVADFSAFWAGPAATHLMACLGADVVKIESRVHPDGMRLNSSRPTDPDWMEWGAVFYGVNANKRSIALNLRQPADVEKAEKLIAWADVVIENFSARVLDDLGLGWDRIRTLNPSAVLIRMPAFGLDGPWRDRTGFAMTVEQASGLAWMTGYRDGGPMDVGGLCDAFGGMHAIVALMEALHQREADGKGALIEVPLVEVALNAAAEQVLQYSLDGTLLTRDGNRGPEGDPQDVYPCAGDDEWLAVSVRPGDAAAVEALTGGDLARWAAARPVAAAVEELADHGVPAAQGVVPCDLALNEQLRARDFFEVLDHPVVGRHPIPSLPFRLAGGDHHGWYRTPPPTLGQHDEQITRQILEAP